MPKERIEYGEEELNDCYSGKKYLPMIKTPDGISMDKKKDELTPVSQMEEG